MWDHLAGTTSAPFTAGEQRRVAVKVIDERGNELLVGEVAGGGSLTTAPELANISWSTWR